MKFGQNLISRNELRKVLFKQKHGKDYEKIKIYKRWPNNLTSKEKAIPIALNSQTHSGTEWVIVTYILCAKEEVSTPSAYQTATAWWSVNLSYELWPQIIQKSKSSVGRFVRMKAQKMQKLLTGTVDGAWRNEEHEDVQIPENQVYVSKSVVKSGTSLSSSSIHILCLRICVELVLILQRIGSHGFTNWDCGA